MKLSSICLALAVMLTTVAQAQEERQGRDGASRERGQQRQGQGRQRGGDQGGRGQRGGGFPGGGFPGGGGPGGGIDKLTLVSAKPIQEELKLGEDELFLVKQLSDELRANSRELMAGIDFRSLPEDERRTKFEELGKKRAELVKESEKGLAELLTEAQAKRLDEIALQLMGVRALANDDVAKKLKLSSDQKKGVEDALKSADDDRRKMFEEARAGGGAGRGGAGGFEGMREKMEEARKKGEEKLLAVLSDEQKKQFEEMKGKSFEVDRRALFSFGGRGGQPGGGGGRGGQPGGRPAGDGGGRPQRPAAE
tara:strand:- start:4001 stop:4927 length:927 start_codon:yes stop_codon:yes gene_type:complete